MINPRPDQPVVGKAADAVCAAYFGLEVALRTLKAGSKVSEVTTALNKVAQAFKCHAAIEPGHRAVAQVRRNVLEVREPKKRSNASGGAPSSPSRVPQSTATQAPQSVANSGQEAAKLPVQGANPGTGVNAGSAGSTAEQPPKPATSQSRSKEEDHVFEAGQVWTINVLMSSGDGKVKERSDLKPTVYQRNSNKTFNLKLKVSRTVFNEIQKRFGTFPFTLR